MPCQQLVERIGELLHAFGLEHLDDIVVVDAGRRQINEQLLRLGPALENRVSANLAVIGKRLDGLRRHRVHRVGADQLLDVDHVAIGGVLRRRGRPERPLLRGTGGSQALPPRAG